MKFTFGNLVGLLGLASAQNLRPATFMHDAATTSVINTSVIFQGIKAEDATTNEDKDIITESVAAAFDQVYGEPDNESGMLGLCGPICRRKRREAAANLPPDAGCGGWGCNGFDINDPMAWTLVKDYIMTDWTCDRCPKRRHKRHQLLTSGADNSNDDNDTEENTMALVSFKGKVPDIQDVALHQKFEQAVCDNMRTSGSEALEGVHDCKLYFYNLKQPMCASSDVLIKIEGVTVNDNETVNKIETAALAAGLESFAFQMISGATLSALTIVLATVDPTDCHGNADATARKFCANLRALGLDTARNCEIATLTDTMMAPANAVLVQEVA